MIRRALAWAALGVVLVVGVHAWRAWRIARALDMPPEVIAELEAMLPPQGLSCPLRDTLECTFCEGLFCTKTEMQFARTTVGALCPEKPKGRKR